ncbi:MAG: hypothetical protein AAFP26_01625 [Planctomycetota bacterium]
MPRLHWLDAATVGAAIAAAVLAILVATSAPRDGTSVRYASGALTQTLPADQPRP